MHMPGWSAKMTISLLLAAAACSSPTEPGLTVSFRPTDANTPETASAAAVSGGIRVTGMIRIPDPCYAGAATSARSGNAVTLTLSATKKMSGACPAVVSALSYEVQISLPPGRYDLRIVHETIGVTVPPREVLRVAVTVP